MNKLFILLAFVCALGKMTAQRHVFYLHGRIVEVQGAKAVDQVNGYGEYRYQDILDSLSARGFKVHSEVRDKNTVVNIYAEKIVVQINDLLKNGTPAKNITVIGASKGGQIAKRISKTLPNKDINYVLLGACEGTSSEIKEEYYGNILSILEKSDSGGPCQPLIEGSSGVSHFKELEINTGLKHGFLYRPIREWLWPAVDWANQKFN